MFACSRCDATTSARFDRCPSCGAFSSCVKAKRKRAHTLRLSDIPPDDRARLLVRRDWDNALGGPGERGALEGTLIFVVGKGGAGKTTDLLDLASRLGKSQRRPCAYASSEREIPALSAQARKIGVDGSAILPVRVHAMREIISFVEEHRPSGLVIDSWSNLEAPVPNDLDLLREALGSAPAWIIHHVTKADEMAGSSKLAHKADAIVWMLKTRLKVTKNWHGPNGVTVLRHRAKFKRPKKK
jgi:predicted ATP-dependent serine protease